MSWASWRKPDSWNSRTRQPVECRPIRVIVTTLTTFLEEARLSRADLRAIDKVFTSSGVDSATSSDRIMEKMSHALSELSENVGIVVSPSLAENRLSHIEFVQLSDKRILVVLVTTSNIIHNKIIRLEDNITQEELEQTARYLNTEFGGKSLVAIRAEILELMSEEKALYDRLLRNAILLCDMSLEGEESTSGDVYVDGASNILSKPDFVDVDRMRELFRTFEEKSRLIKILNECVAREQLGMRGRCSCRHWSGTSNLLDAKLCSDHRPLPAWVKRTAWHARRRRSDED